MRSLHRNALRNRRHSERGVALVVTLLLLVLMIALTLAMVIATSSDTLINHYYKNSRSSFYAADSGLNIARASIKAKLQADLVNGATIGLTTPPLTSGAGGEEYAVQNYISTTYGGGFTSINSGPDAGNSWPGEFEITYICMTTTCLTQPQPPTTCHVSFTGTPTPAPYNADGPCASIVMPTFVNDPNVTGCNVNAAGCGVITEMEYMFPYTMTAMGQSTASEKTTLMDTGYMIVDATVPPPTNFVNFASFGTFLEQYPGWPNCGNPFAGGTLSGKIYTNQGWTWGLGQSYTFAGQVGSVSPNFYWNYGNTGSCDSTPNLTDKQGGNSITPTWNVKPPQLGIPPIPLPQNDFNQKEAIVDSLGNTWGPDNYTAAQQDAAMNAVLKNVNGTNAPYPVAGTATAGVYLPYTQTVSGGVTTNTFSGGGIYVEGAVTSAVLSTAANQQIITIVQGSTTTKITLNLPPSAPTTTVAQTVGATTTNTIINGLPENLTGTSPTEGAMLYVDGNINSLSGPSSGPAIQNTSALTITSADNITITGNITYATEPVTLNSSDTLISGNNNGQVLGIFTANPNGVIGFSVAHSGDNLRGGRLDGGDLESAAQGRFTTSETPSEL